MVFKDPAVVRLKMPLGKRKSYSARARTASRKGRTGYANIVRKRARTSGPARPLQAVARLQRRVMSMIETKEITHQFGPNQGLPHNNTVQLLDNDSGANFNVFRLSQGATDTDNHQNTGGNRIGDAIEVKGVKLKFFIENALDRPRVWYRMMMLRAPRGDASLNTGTLRSTLFKGRCNNKMLDGIDTKRYKIIWQTECNVSASNVAAASVGVTGVPTITTSGGVGTKLVQAWIPGRKFGRNGHVQYEQGSTTNVKFFDYILVFVAYDWYGTPQDVNTVGRLNEGYSTIYFKDA